MKKFFLSLALVAFAASVSMAQTPVKVNDAKVAPKHEKCEGHKDGKACDKPADQQCDDCKAKAAMKHECKEGQGHKCEKAEGMKHECKEGKKHECKEGEGKQCDKAAMKHECKEGKAPMMKKHECKEGEAKQCDTAAMMKKHEECKDHKDGQPCTKPADQQCPDCKEKAAAKKN